MIVSSRENVTWFESELLKILPQFWSEMIVSIILN